MVFRPNDKIKRKVEWIVSGMFMEYFGQELTFSVISLKTYDLY